MVVGAKDDEGIVRGFLLEKGVPGMKAEYIEGKFSLRVAPTCEFRLINAFVPEANLLPTAKGLSAPFQLLNKARFSIAWGAIGAQTGIPAFV